MLLPSMGLSLAAKPRLLVAVEDAVQVEPEGEFELKGIRRPLAAYQVIGAVSPSLRDAFNGARQKISSRGNPYTKTSLSIR
jgi:hypothetical protein